VQLIWAMAILTMLAMRQVYHRVMHRRVHSYNRANVIAVRVS